MSMTSLLVFSLTLLMLNVNRGLVRLQFLVLSIVISRGFGKKIGQ
jgi:hypothetical protein